MRQQHTTQTAYKYDGITIHAAAGLHEFAMEVILNNCKGNKRVLDLGSGSGAFTKRLQDHGFTTTSADLTLDTFALGSKSYELDFNADFASPFSGESFDVIVALEVIEHLENPLHFLRQLKLISNPETMILVSFPNLYLYTSLFTFYKNGTFGNWSPFLYWETGHQTVIPDWLFEEHLKKTKFTLEKKYFCAFVTFPTKPFRRILHEIFFRLASLLNRAISSQARKSEVVLFQFRNSERRRGAASSAAGINA